MNAFRFALVAVAVAVAGCDWSYGASTETSPPDASGSTQTSQSRSLRVGTPTGAADAARPRFEGSYAPLSKTAMSITDTIEFDGEQLLFGFGHTYGTEPVGVASDSDGAAFAKVATAPGGARFEVRRVTEELVNARAENGGLCKPDAATFIVLGAVPGPEGFTRDVVMLAYKGAAAPTAASAEQDLCGTFLYGPAE